MNSFTPQEVAINMYHRGEIPLLCEANEKKPKLTGWKETKYDSEAEVVSLFSGACNVGWLLQDDQYVIDIDDANIARMHTVDLLKKLGIFCNDAVGRKTKPLGKIFLTSKAGIAEDKRLHPVSKKVIVETLAKGRNAIVPPSSFKGEKFIAVSNHAFQYELQTVSPQELKQAVDLLELLSLLNEYYPSEGNRDNAMLSLCRLFGLRDEYTSDLVTTFCQTLAKLNHDKERFRATWHKQYAKIVESPKTTGIKHELTKHWFIEDEAVINKLVEIFQTDEDLKKSKVLRNWKPLLYETQQDIMKKTFEPPKFLIEDILPVGLTCLAGRPKRGKTRFIDWVSQCIAEGKPVWDKQTEQGQVLQLLLEDTQDDVHLRGVEMNIKDGHPNKIPITMEHWDGSQLGKGVEEHIEDFIERVDKPQLVIIDTYVKVSAYKKGKDIYREQSVELGRLQKIAKMNKIAIVLIHHTTKATYEDIFDEISGSTALQGICDTLMVMGGNRGEGDKHIPLYVIGRRILDSVHNIAPDPNNNWDHLGEGTNPTKIEVSGWIKKIFDAVNELTEKQETRIGVNTKTITDYLGLTDPELTVSEMKKSFPQMAKTYDNYYKKMKRMASNGELSYGKNDFHFCPSYF